MNTQIKNAKNVLVVLAAMSAAVFRVKSRSTRRKLPKPSRSR